MMTVKEFAGKGTKLVTSDVVELNPLSLSPNPSLNVLRAGCIDVN